MQKKLPQWLTKRFPASQEIDATIGLLEKLGLNTVCQGAECPNLVECFARRTATFMIMGDTCTRNCRFCAVAKGLPREIDKYEPGKVAKAALQLGLKHVVVTSVTRDDLPDGGASHFAAIIREIKNVSPGMTIEILTPDFQGELEFLSVIVQAHPNIFNHNVETIPRLYPAVRPKAQFSRSLELLKKVKELDRTIFTKSGLMVGFGESPKEVLDLMVDLRGVKCDVLTIGQYLQPSPHHLPVVEFVHPEWFQYYQTEGEKLGFLHVSAGPFVRSSYHAAEVFNALS